MTASLQIDVTAVLLSGLRQQVPDARWVVETPDKLETLVPLGRVQRVGGGDDGVRLDTATIVIDCFTSYANVGTEGSREFAYNVVAGIYALVGQIINGATITRARKMSGPVPLDYENPAVRRQGLTFTVAVKPA